MTRPRPFAPPRAHASYVTGALTAKEAAARLTRLEFDIARLELEAETAARRARRAREQLVGCLEQRNALLKVISRPSAALIAGARNGA